MDARVLQADREVEVEEVVGYVPRATPFIMECAAMPQVAR